VIILVKDLIVNGSLIISFLFIAFQLTKNNNFSTTSNIKFRFMAGIVGGVFGSFLMLFAIKVSDTIIVDMRNIALIIATICGGWVTSLVSVIIMVLFRVGVYGYNLASITATIVLIILCITCISILKLIKSTFKQKYWCMIIVSLFYTFIAFSILIDNKEKLINLFFCYGIIFLVIAYFSYHVMTYLQRSNEMFRRYKKESGIDFLTGLCNYRKFDELFNKQIKIVNEGNEDLSVLAIDIDHFKKVNDTYGHTEGDKVLQKLAVILKSTSRHFDIVARCGGEEFAVLLLDCTYQKALEIAERIRSTVEKETFFHSKGIMFNITISIGVATFPESTENINKLLQQADDALYEAKRAGRNRVFMRSQA
jgi:diguanylate cyclase